MKTLCGPVSFRLLKWIWAIFYCRRINLEKELVAQLWRISWDDIHMSNMDKVLRSGSRITLSLVSKLTHTNKKQFFRTTSKRRLESKTSSQLPVRPACRMVQVLPKGLVTAQSDQLSTSNFLWEQLNTKSSLLWEAQEPELKTQTEKAQVVHCHSVPLLT